MERLLVNSFMNDKYILGDLYQLKYLQFILIKTIYEKI